MLDKFVSSCDLKISLKALLSQLYEILFFLPNTKSNWENPSFELQKISVVKISEFYPYLWMTFEGEMTVLINVLLVKSRYCSLHCGSQYSSILPVLL